MAVTKTKITVTIDCDLHEAARNKYGNVSGRINELLSMDLYGNDEKDELIERLHNLKLEEKSITKRLCELEQREVQLQNDNDNRDTVLSWIKEVYLRNGVIGLNKLKQECKRHNVDVDDMVRAMDESGVAYVNYV